MMTLNDIFNRYGFKDCADFNDNFEYIFNKICKEFVSSNEVKSSDLDTILEHCYRIIIEIRKSYNDNKLFDKIMKCFIHVFTSEQCKNSLYDVMYYNIEGLKNDSDVIDCFYDFYFGKGEGNAPYFNFCFSVISDAVATYSVYLHRLSALQEEESYIKNEKIKTLAKMESPSKYDN